MDMPYTRAAFAPRAWTIPRAVEITYDSAGRGLLYLHNEQMIDIIMGRAKYGYGIIIIEKQIGSCILVHVCFPVVLGYKNLVKRLVYFFPLVLIRESGFS